MDAFKKLNAAYACLSDEKKRSHYDRFGSEPGQNGGMNFDHGDINDIFKQAFNGQDIGDIFAQAFGQHMQGGGRGRGGQNLNDLLGGMMQ